MPTIRLTALALALLASGCAQKAPETFDTGSMMIPTPPANSGVVRRSSPVAVGDDTGSMAEPSAPANSGTRRGGVKNVAVDTGSMAFPDPVAGGGSRPVPAR